MKTVAAAFGRPSAPPPPAAAPWPAWTPLEIDLMHWAAEHHTAAAVAFMDSPDLPYARKCLGAIFRRRCADAPSWLFWIAAERPADVLALSPAIGTVDLRNNAECAAWGDAGVIPGRGGWRWWIKGVADAVEVLP